RGPAAAGLPHQTRHCGKRHTAVVARPEIAVEKIAPAPVEPAVLAHEGSGMLEQHSAVVAHRDVARAGEPHPVGASAIEAEELHPGVVTADVLAAFDM